ncbi:hypothetical protein KI387_012849, partial [Taxus chinensis]
MNISKHPHKNNPEEEKEDLAEGKLDQSRRKNLRKDHRDTSFSCKKNEPIGGEASKPSPMKEKKQSH